MVVIPVLSNDFIIRNEEKTTIKLRKVSVKITGNSINQITHSSVVVEISFQGLLLTVDSGVRSLGHCI